jgi:hypothetical protein
MGISDQPPLHSIAREQINMLLHKVDERHWPLITSMRVKSFYPSDAPVPPQMPEHLRHQIEWYASTLFKTEADQYEQFRSDARYGAWLSSLADRTINRVMKNLDNLEKSGTNVLESLVGVSGALILGYHGLTMQGVEEGLRTLLRELCGQYEIGTAPGQTGVSVTKPTPTGETEPTKPAPSLSRAELANAYIATHPGVVKLDICWAAGQRYTEWKRWLRGASVLKDGSTPDRAFRALLESGKAPQEYKTRPRPKGWK